MNCIKTNPLFSAELSLSACRIRPLRWVIAIIIFASCVSGQQHGLDRNLGKNTIFIRLDHSLDSVVCSGFSSSLLTQLTQCLPPLGYNVARDTVKSTASTDSTSLLVSIVAQIDTSGQRILSATVLPPTGGNRVSVDSARLRPLMAVSIPDPDTVAAVFLTARKIAENLRERYSRRIVITSVPPGASVESSTGLSGTCPVQWLVPFGMVDVYAQKKGYLPKTARVHRYTPGIDTISLGLVRRMPYHSKFFVPAAAAGIASIALYGVEAHYYNRYRSLGAAELNNDPGSFAKTFNTAQTCERLAGGMAALGALSFTLSFFW